MGEQLCLIETKQNKKKKTRGTVLAILGSEFWGDLESICSWTEQGTLSRVSQLVSGVVSGHIQKVPVGSSLSALLGAS